jgi:outer membrane protein
MMPMALLLVALPAVAAPLDLSYDDALGRALARNPSLLGAEQDLVAAEGAVTAARGGFDPTLSGEAGLSSATDQSVREFGEVLSYSRSTSWGAGLAQSLPTGTALSLDWNTTRSQFRYELPDVDLVVEDENQTYSSLTATVSQALLKGHKMAWNLQAVRQASRARDVTELGLQAERQQVLADVAAAYWGAWYLERLVAIAEQTLAVALEEQRVVDAQVDLGGLAPVERARTAAAVAQARSARIRARNDHLAAQDSLLILLGEEPGAELRLTTAPEAPVAVDLDEAEVVRAALAGNPSLAAARASEDAAAANAADARHALLPELGATGSYGLRGYEDSASAAAAELFSARLPEWYLGASLSAPLGNRAARGNHQAEQAQAATARIEREALERSLAQQVRSQVRAVESASAQVDLAAANLAAAEQTLAAEQALRAAGRGLQKDVLSAVADREDAAVGLEKARADHQLALVELRRLKGDLAWEAR